MKALIISNKREIIEFTASFLKKNDYDVITYRWFIKALDNLEEIQPDLIILSAAEYPRHWKTLASFLESGIGGNNAQLYLYDQKSLSDEEKRKAQKLGVKAFIQSLTEENLENAIPPAKNRDNSQKIVENFSDELNIRKKENLLAAFKNKIIFTNPVSGNFIFGTADFEQNSNVLICRFDCDCAQNLFENQIIKYVSLYDENSKISVFSAKIIKISENFDKISANSNKSAILIQPQEYYEKN